LRQNGGSRSLGSRQGFSGQHDHPRDTGAYYGRMGRIIGAVLGAILSAWFIFTVIGWFSAVFKTFLITGLIAAAVFIVVWLLAGRRRQG
jgi:predicted lipid-binding transport protein (Tim44 family)